MFAGATSAALTAAGIAIVAQPGHYVVENASGGAFDIHTFTPGTFGGVAYASSDQFYSGPGVHGITLYEDASGKTVASYLAAPDLRRSLPPSPAARARPPSRSRACRSRPPSIMPMARAC